MDALARAEFGKECERQALRYLEGQGFSLIEKNYNTPLGEIDLIMQDKDELVFVEVRSKHRNEYGDALDSITQGKINKIVRTTLLYLQEKDLLYKVNSRFDVVVIQPKDGKMHLEWLKNAFTVDRF